jgi:hypothetical protein
LIYHPKQKDLPYRAEYLYVPLQVHRPKENRLLELEIIKKDPLYISIHYIFLCFNKLELK